VSNDNDPGEVSDYECCGYSKYIAAPDVISCDC